MGRGITLRGEAARGFIEGAMGKPLTEKREGKPRKELDKSDKYLVIATKVTMFMKSGGKKDAAAACLLLKILKQEGLEKAYELARG